MRVRCKRVLLVICSLALLTGIVPDGPERAAAQKGGGWLAVEAPGLDKVMELSPGTPPDGQPTDCANLTYQSAPDADVRTLCTFNSPLGPLTAEGFMATGGGSVAELTGPWRSSHFIPTAGSSIALLSVPSSSIGSNIGVYPSLSKADLEFVHQAYDSSYYRVKRQPDFLLTNPATGKPLQVNTDDVSFSFNGAWMIASMPKQGLVRVDMHDYSIKVFAGPVEQEWYLGLAYPPLAISNDGLHVAVNSDLWGEGNIQVYDLSTCDDQSSVPETKRTYCASKDIWNNGTARSGRMGLLSRQPDLMYPTRLRFIDNENLSFNARYAHRSATDYKAAMFVATAPGGTRHRLGLLGMGDSYISGEGTGVYLPATDTANNHCHLSKLSYPFLLGQTHFDSYNSAACSGARTYDIVGSDPQYAGQVKEGVAVSRQDWQNILAGFLPGYIYQQEFAAAYQPEAIVLSAGGNDIGFGDIVKACLAPGTCYETQDDRTELVTTINNAYAKLVATYTALRQRSGGARIYVVGYPQVAKPGGNCGLNVHLDSDELTFVSQLVTYLDQTISRAALTAGVYYVDTEHAFDDHRLCEAGDPAMNGLTAGDDVGLTVARRKLGIIGNESYHPTALGHRLLAGVIAAQTVNLTAPMPAPAGPAGPITIEIPTASRPLNHVIHDGTVADDVWLRGDAQQVTVDGSMVQLQPGSRYQIVLHSEPVLLDEGSVDARGNIAATVHVPATMEPGFHVLHVYGTDMAGNALDIQKTVYVSAASDDYDGDGMPNTQSPCLVVAPTGIDTDSDGLDDACDSVAVTPTSSAVLGGMVSLNRNGVATLLPTDATSGEEGGPSAGSVLGAAVTSAAPDSSGAGVSGQTAGTGLAARYGSETPTSLYYVEWRPVVIAGMAVTTLATIAYYSFRRS